MKEPFPQFDLVVVSQHYSPSTAATAQLIYDLVTGLHARGMKIGVITATHSETIDSCPFPVYRVRQGQDKHSSLRTKLISGISFTLSALRLSYALSNQGRATNFLVVSNPPFIVLGFALLSLLGRLDYFFLLQDLFPRSAVITGVLAPYGPLSRLFRKLIAFSCFQSKATILLSSQMHTRAVIEYGTKCRFVSIPNWAVIQKPAVRKASNFYLRHWNLEGKFVILYSGNFGRLHDVTTLLESARVLRDEEIVFLFVGNGAKIDYIRRYKDTFALKNVSLYPLQPLDRLHELLAVADLVAVTMTSGAEDTVAPSKLYGALAAKKPVLLISAASSKASSLVRDNSMGITFELGDSITLAESLRSLSCNALLLASMGERAFRSYQTMYGKEKSIDQYYQLFKRLTC